MAEEFKSSMEHPVAVTVTNRPVGKWLVTPFSYKFGVQRGESGSDVRYEVPVYAVSVDGGRPFKALRFGLINRNVTPPLPVRACDAGITEAITVHPAWLPTYSPHRYTRPARAGAWRLIEGQRFLIHEGPEEPSKLERGSLGCIEIVGAGEWNAFLLQLETIGGETVATLAASKAITVTIEDATYPMARLV